MARLSPFRPLLTMTLVLIGTLGRAAAQQAPPSPEALEKLVAPIALYPDPLVAQILPASTNPLEIFEAADSVANGARPSAETASKWDPSIQALLSYPTVLKMMRDKIQWTQNLGQAFVSDQAAVLAAIQTVRHTASAAGNLKSTSQQSVTTKGSTIVIEPAQPDVIYVPQYNPVAILAPAPYYAYSPLMTFGVGFAAGAATAYACNWGGYGSSSVVVNNNYHYSYNNNYNSYSHYNSNTGSWGTYHPQSGTYHGYNANTGTYGGYNPHTGNYHTYNPSTGAYNYDGNKGTWDGKNTSSDSYNANKSYNSSNTNKSYNSSNANKSYNNQSLGASQSRGSGASSSWGDHSGWGSGGGSGGDAFHGLGGGGWGSREASGRGGDSWGGGGGGGGFGGHDGGGFGGYRGGGFRGRR